MRGQSMKATIGAKFENYNGTTYAWLFVGETRVGTVEIMPGGYRAVGMRKIDSTLDEAALRLAKSSLRSLMIDVRECDSVIASLRGDGRKAKKK